MNMNSNINDFDSVLKYFPQKIRAVLSDLKDSCKAQCTEIRLRIGRNVSITVPGGVHSLGRGSSLINNSDNIDEVTAEDMNRTVKALCDGSIYSCQDEINHGFITVGRGCRAGVCGRAVTSGGKITAVRDISSVNLRIARNIKGSADRVLEYIIGPDGLESTVIISPPGGGKTTVLRDAAASLSAHGNKVSVVDERGELGAYAFGAFGHDLGDNTDVLSYYPKSEGILTAVRTLSPDIILCDEIGDDSDVRGVFECSRLGVPLLVTAHARSADDIKNRPYLKKLLCEGGFENIIILEGHSFPGRIRQFQKVSEAFKEGEPVNA